MHRLVVLVSGTGTNLQALIDHVHLNPSVQSEMVLVVSSKAGAPALERAQAVGIPVAVVALNDPSNREERDRRLVDVVAAAQPDLVVMAGWMSIVTSTFLDHFPDRVINLHPSLLPAFPGMHAIEDALAWGVRLTGVTVHLAEEAVDGGPPVLQECVPVHPDDTVDSLRDRVREVEHRLLTRSVVLYSEGRVRRDADSPRQVIVSDEGGS